VSLKLQAKENYDNILTAIDIGTDEDTAVEHNTEFLTDSDNVIYSTFDESSR
jgi:hypothetical protein